MARKTTATAPAPEKVSTPEGANEFDLERISVTSPLMKAWFEPRGW